VSIQRSSASEIAHLVAALGGEGPASAMGRDAAVARLRVIGARAVPHLVAAWKSVGRRARAHGRAAGARRARRAAPRVGRPRRPLRPEPACGRPPRTPPAGCSTGLGDRTCSTSSRRWRSIPGNRRAVRVTAVAVLHDLPRRLIAPILARLAADDDPAVRAAAHAEITPDDTPQAMLAEAAAGRGPSDPHLVLPGARRRGPAMPLPTLHRLVGTLRDREQRAGTPAAAHDWQQVRGATHTTCSPRAAAVSRSTTCARRSAHHTAPLPETFVRALAALGDGETLDDLAAAFSAAPDAPHGPWALALRDAPGPSCSANASRSGTPRSSACTPGGRAGGDGGRDSPEELPVESSQGCSVIHRRDPGGLRVEVGRFFNRGSAELSGRIVQGLPRHQ
jgi:hypothetical protein